MTFVPIPTFTNELVESIFAGSSIKTWVFGAFINVRLASRSVESSWAVKYDDLVLKQKKSLLKMFQFCLPIAFVTSYDVDAFSAVLARTTEAFVDFIFAVSASIARSTFALEIKKGRL